MLEERDRILQSFSAVTDFTLVDDILNFSQSVSIYFLCMCILCNNKCRHFFQIIGGDIFFSNQLKFIYYIDFGILI